MPRHPRSCRHLFLTPKYISDRCWSSERWKSRAFLIFFTMHIPHYYSWIKANLWCHIFNPEWNISKLLFRNSFVKTEKSDRLHMLPTLCVSVLDTLQATSMSRCRTVGFSGNCVPITSSVSSSWARTWCDSTKKNNSRYQDNYCVTHVSATMRQYTGANRLRLAAHQFHCSVFLHNTTLLMHLVTQRPTISVFWKCLFTYATALSSSQSIL